MFCYGYQISVVFYSSESTVSGTIRDDALSVSLGESFRCRPRLIKLLKSHIVAVEKLTRYSAVIARGKPLYVDAYRLRRQYDYHKVVFIRIREIASSVGIHGSTRGELNHFSVVYGEIVSSGVSIQAALGTILTLVESTIRGVEREAPSGEEFIHCLSSSAILKAPPRPQSSEK